MCVPGCALLLLFGKVTDRELQITLYVKIDHCVLLWLLYVRPHALIFVSCHFLDLKVFAMSKLFSGGKHAQLYATYRPRYPDALRATILQYLKEGGGGTNLALDLGCGNGQATLELSEHFGHVIGSDISEAQIAAAPKDNPKVRHDVAASAKALVLLCNAGIWQLFVTQFLVNIYQCM